MTSFRLPLFDPDISYFTFSDWLEDANKLKQELNISDQVMITRAGEAMQNLAQRYYRKWRPEVRSWENFCAYFSAAFLEEETPGSLAFTAATLRSRDCESLASYGAQKLRCIRRFHGGFDWTTILSMVEHGLDHKEAKATIKLQEPRNDRNLLHILSEYDAKREERLLTANTGKQGKEKNNVERHSKRDQHSCNNCGKQDHPKVRCWQKHNGPKELPHNVNCDLSSCKVTVPSSDKTVSLKYIIDSGMDTSLLSESAAQRLGASIEKKGKPSMLLGKQTVFSVGMCSVIVTLPTITLDVCFTVVPTKVIPKNVDLILGWDVTNRSQICVKAGKAGLELYPASCEDNDHFNFMDC